MSRGLSRALAEILVGVARSELPSAALTAAKSRLFHAWGVALASSGLDPAEMAWRAMSDRPGDSVVLGRPTGLQPDEAAFVNAVTSHSSLQEDCGPGGLTEGSHPSTYVLPAALAATESVGGSGRDLLAGVVAGYEAVSRIGEAAPVEIVRRRFRPVAVMGPFGAAAAAAIVHGADADTVATAIDLAANMSGGSTQGIFDGTMEPYLHAGFAARNGLFAARVAAAGPVTSPSSLEGAFGFFRAYGGTDGDADVLLGERDRLGVERPGTKPFAACLQNQGTVALVLDGFPGGVDAEQVRRLVIVRPERGTNGLDSPGVSREAPFHNMLEAQMSARFTAAAALLGRDVRDPRFFRGGFADPDVEAVARRTDLVDAPDGTVSVRVELERGETRVLDGDVTGVLFPPAEDIRSRFLDRARPVLGDAAAEKVASLLDDAENVADIGELSALMQVSRK